MKVTIDISGIRNKRELHRLFKLHLDLPSYYGGNLDALYDCLTERPGETEITFVNACDAQEGMASYIRSLRKLTEDVADKKKSFVPVWKD